MTTDKKDFFIILQPCSEGVLSLQEELRKNTAIEIISSANVDEAVQAANQLMPCIVIASIVNNASIGSIINMLKRMERGMRSGLLKTMIVSHVKNKQLNNLIAKLGVTDFIEEPVTVGKLLFKTKIQLKVIEAIRKKEENKNSNKEKIILKTMDEYINPAHLRALDLPSTSIKPALQLAEDCFLFRGMKRVGKKMLLEMNGPSPACGQWMPYESKLTGVQKWCWVDNDINTTNKGWICEGEKPQFNNETGNWQFLSEKPSLDYSVNDEKIASKFTTANDGSIEITEDSTIAAENIRNAEARALEKRNEKKKELLTEQKDKKTHSFEEEVNNASEEVAAETTEANAFQLLGKQSKNIQKFLEQRKLNIKKENQEIKKAAPPLKSSIFKNYIGLSVAISDAIYEKKDIRDSADRICQLICENIKHCYAYLSETTDNGEYFIFGSNNQLTPKNSILQENNLQPGVITNKIFHEVTIHEGERIEKLGYLILEPRKPRNEFNKDEVSSLVKLSKMIANYWDDYKKMHSQKTKERKTAA